jgi:hypothetical protein
MASKNIIIIIAIIIVVAAFAVVIIIETIKSLIFLITGIITLQTLIYFILHLEFGSIY